MALNDQTKSSGNGKNKQKVLGLLNLIAVDEKFEKIF